MPAFDLVPKTSRTTVGLMALVPLGALTMMIPAAIEEGSPLRAVGSAVALAVCGAVAWWFWRRVGRLHLAIDGDTLTLTDGRRVRRGDRKDLRGESGHVASSGRYASSKSPAIAFRVGDRRVLVQSMDGATTVRGPALRGLAYLLPGDQLAHLQQLLRLR